MLCTSIGTPVDVGESWQNLDNPTATGSGHASRLTV
jgi:hypothetical protein